MILCNLCLQSFKLPNSRLPSLSVYTLSVTQHLYFRCHRLGLHVLFRPFLCTYHASVAGYIAHLAAHDAKHGSSSSTQALLNLAVISCELSEMNHPEEATAALLAGAMTAGNSDWGAGATGVPAAGAGAGAA